MITVSDIFRVRLGIVVVVVVTTIIITTTTTTTIRLEEMRNACNILGGKPERKNPRRPRRT